MLIHVHQLLNAEELAQARALLAEGPWIDGAVAAGEPACAVKRHPLTMHLRRSVGETDPGVVGLTGTCHNLLRLWADT
jgi:predicted 2-oxoglutarate/Fe(II)-dependent dioxygenase YbiX